MAGLGPPDVDTVQLYDCFTYMVLAQLEDYGFCKKGESGPFARSGALRMDGATADQYVWRSAFGGALSRACSRSSKARASCRAFTDRTGRFADAEIALVSGHGGNYVCHSTLILGKA